MLAFYRLNRVSLKRWPTILDYYFYYDRSTYQKMRYYDKYNRKLYYGSNIEYDFESNWRSEILWALEQDGTLGIKSVLRSIDTETERRSRINPKRVSRPSLRRFRCTTLAIEVYWERHPILEFLFIEQFLFLGVWYKDKLRLREMKWKLGDLRVDLNF